MKYTFPQIREKAQRVLLRWARLLAVLACLGALTPWIGGVHFLVELGSHFMPLYILAAWPAIVVLIALGDKRMAVVAGAALMLAGYSVASSYLPLDMNPARGMALRLMVSNVLTSNTNHAAFIDLVRNEKPDVVAVMEIDPNWVEALEPLNGDYPHRVLRPREDDFGIGILSKFPLEELEVIDLCGVPGLQARLNLARQRVTLFAVHTLPPVNAEYASTRNQQLNQIALLARNVRGLTIVAGDLNTTMWSPAFRSLVRESEMHDARQGFGVLPTWPAELAPMMIPIDHCLYRSPIRVEAFRLGPYLGSDHFPLIVDFSVPSRRTTRNLF